MSDPGPPPPPPEPPRRGVAPWGSPVWTGGPDNPTTLPSRPIAAVERDLARARHQHSELEADMARTGQTGALVVAELTATSVGAQRAFTRTTWVEGPISVLPRADVVDVFVLPTSVSGEPRVLSLRWDAAARVCTPCWQDVPDLDPPRVITRRWPTPAELEVLDGLALVDQPPSGG